MREPSAKTIHDIEYRMYPMSPFKSAKLLTRILKLIGKPLSVIVQDTKKEHQAGGLLDADINPKILGEALEAMSTQLEENQVEKLMKDLLPLELITYKDETRDSFSKITGIDGYLNKQDKPLMHLFELVRFSLEVNYSDFLGEIAGRSE